VAGGRRLLLGLLRFIGPSMWIGRLALGGPMPIAGDSSFLRKQKREDFVRIFFPGAEEKIVSELAFAPNIFIPS